MTGTNAGQAHGELAAYMDILSHDILNNNQAILSYIEFIATSPTIDDRSREYAAKAAMKVNISTLIFESIRGLCLADRSEMPPLTPTGLSDVMKGAVQAFGRFFPDMRVVLPDDLEGAPSILANEMVNDLVLMSMVNLALLERGEDGGIIMRLRHRDGRVELDISCADVKVPPAILGSDLPKVTTDSRSKMVRIAGFILAKLMARALNGDFSVRAGTDGGTREGCTITITLSTEAVP